jgi:hypothetical protein
VPLTFILPLFGGSDRNNVTRKWGGVNQEIKMVNCPNPQLPFYNKGVAVQLNRNSDAEKKKNKRHKERNNNKSKNE